VYINYKGDVILCCSDYNYEVVFGNVMEQSFGDIYNSPEYRKYRKAHAQGRGKKLPLCEKCDRIR
jgi:radical SAM protein with 4Fe4S-binding SPASM domain